MTRETDNWRSIGEIAAELVERSLRPADAAPPEQHSERGASECAAQSETDEVEA